MTRPNGVATNYTYDNLSRLLSVLHQLSGSTINGAVYTVDSAGNRTAKTDEYANVTSNYSYDPIYELAQVTQGSTTTESYTYDPVGNRLTSLGVSPYQYNPSNEMVSTPNGLYVYDNNGNLTSETTSTGTTNYSWDFENRMTQVTLPNSGGTVSFKYDPLGRRIEKVSPTTTSIFVYDGDNLAETVNGSGSEIAGYAQDLNIDGPLAMLRGTTTDYYEADGLGSVTSLTGSNASLAQSYTYDSFGNTTNSSGSLTNFFRHTSREFDTETNLYYYRARYYDPSAGRFLSEDPVKFSGDINFYAYVADDPANLFDPLGLSPKRKGDSRWRRCNAQEEAFCIRRCESEGRIYVSCRVAQTKRIKSLAHGPDWYDYVGDPSCYCKDPEDCPYRSPNKVPNPDPQPQIKGAPLLPFFWDWLEEWGWVGVFAE